MLCKLLEAHDAKDVQALDLRDPNAPDVPEPTAAPAAHSAQPETDHKIDWPARLAEAESRWQTEAQAQYQKGRREGMAAGKQAEAQALKPVLENLAASLADIAGLRDRLRRSAEADLVKLAVAIARRVLHREVGVDPEALAALARHALERLRGREVARVRAHPDHAAVIRQLLGARHAAATVDADPSLAPGSVIFETTMGSLDVSVEAQLAEIERGLADRLGDGA